MSLTNLVRGSILPQSLIYQFHTRNRVWGFGQASNSTSLAAMVFLYCYSLESSLLKSIPAACGSCIGDNALKRGVMQPRDLAGFVPFVCRPTHKHRHHTIAPRRGIRKMGRQIHSLHYTLALNNTVYLMPRRYSLPCIFIWALIQNGCSCQSMLHLS